MATEPRIRVLTPIPTGIATLDRWQREIIAILNPFLRSVVTRVTGTAPISVVGANDLTLSHDDSGVTVGTFTNATVTVDAKGHVTAASNGSGGGVTSVGATAPITSSGGTTPTISTSLATDKLLGRDTAGTGVAEEIAVGGGLEFTGSGGIQRSALTGDVTASAGGGATTLATVNGNVGSFGDATHVAAVTVNAKGLVTAASSVAITGTPPGGSAGGDLAGTYPNPTVTQARGLRETAGPTTLTMGAVADGQFVKRVGTTLVGGAAGLSFFTEAQSTTSPNDTTYDSSFTATGTATNIDATLKPKGNGAVLAQIPDGTSTGGNKRGTNAVDWQTKRSNAAHVASGTSSVVNGGERMAATSVCSYALGGFQSSATGQYAGVGGQNCGASSDNSFAVGQSNTASGVNSNVNGGFSNGASGQYSYIPGGAQAGTRGLYGRMSAASGGFSISGDAQRGVMITRRQTTDATANTILTADNSAPDGSTNTNILPNNFAYAVRVQVVARQTGGASGSAGDTKAWELICLVKRGASAATTALVGSVTSTVVGNDAAAAAWAATLAVNTTRGAIEVAVTGEASKNIDWVATMWTTEVQ